MQHITSQKNPTVQQLAALKTPKGRKEQGLYLIEGFRLVREAMHQKVQPVMLVVQEDRTDTYGDIVLSSQQTGAIVFAVPAYVMARLCDTEQPQGLAAALTLPAAMDLQGPRILALDGIADPGNMGTMLRTAAAFGIADVLLSKGCADAFAPKCVRAGMGAHFRLRIRTEENMADALHKLRDDGYEIVGASVTGREAFPETGEKRAFVIGSEANGISDEVAGCCTSLYRIPMASGSESLNASVAAGIVLFQSFLEQNRD